MLIIAIVISAVTIIKALSDGTSVTDETSRSNQEMFNAAKKGDVGRVKQPVKKSTSVAGDMSELNLELFNAAKNGDLEKVKQLVEKGGDVNFSNTDFVIKSATVLIIATLKGHLDIVQFLVENGADVNAGNTGRLNGHTPLFIASSTGHLDIVQFLVEKGADINAGIMGNTPLISASEGGYLNIVEFLVDKGADVNAVTTGRLSGHTALMYASKDGYLDIVKFLVQKGADVNARTTSDVEGSTPLMWASSEGHLDTVKFLVENGADVNAVNQEGKTAQDYAVKSVKAEVSDYIKTLLKYNPFTSKSYTSTFTYFTQAEDTTETNTQLPAVKGLLKKEANGINDIGSYQQITKDSGTHLEITIDVAFDENKLVFCYGTDPQNEEISDQIPLYSQIFTEDTANTYAYLIFPKEWKLSGEYQVIKAIKNSDGSNRRIMACSPENSEFSLLLRNYNALLEGTFWSRENGKSQLAKAVDIISEEDENGRITQLQEKYKDYQIYEIPFNVPKGITQAYSNISRSSTIYFDKSSLTGNGKIFIEIPQITFEQTASGITRKAGLEGLAYELDLAEVKGNYKPEHRFVEKSTGLQKKTIDLGDAVTMEFVYIPAGEFMMGSPLNEKRRRRDEGPQHRVKISEGFWMGVYEVTNAQYQQFVKESNYNGRRESKGNYLRHILLEDKRPEAGSDYPVRWISWNNACAFCEWLSVKQGRTYRLPTEEQWEYACRAGTNTPLNIEDHGLFLESSDGRAAGIRGTHSVGQNKPNSFGLYDMFDNVKEWCQDWYGSYSDTNEVDPEGPSSGDDRVVRGDYSGDIISYRCANRFYCRPDKPDLKIGFRAVCVDQQEN